MKQSRRVSVSLLSIFVLLCTVPVMALGSKELAAQLEEIRKEVAAQDEEAVPVAPPQKRVNRPPSRDKNVYFGDTHVHTDLSFDAVLNGNRLSLRDAYRFANGAPLTLLTGETMQLSRPLDFVVMTDHAESFGLFVTCARDKLTAEQQKFCAGFEQPDRAFFRSLREDGQKRPPVRPTALCRHNEVMCERDARTTWDDVRAAAEEFNRPGEFTAFAGYEYSPPLPKQGSIHRNVVFRSSHTPDRAVSAFDAASELDLWRALESECTGECEFLTIPHNMNKTWGLAYAGRTIDGDRYTAGDWALRGRVEHIAEIFQTKGSSECAIGAGATDEECNFEQIVPICQGEPTSGCSGRTSFAREGLKIGMQLQANLGFNPLRFGFVGSTDTHNSAPGDTEENDWRGVTALHDSPALRRLGLPSANKTFKKQQAGGQEMERNPGGLAAIWAPENTRDAIFEAMVAKEAYATSGNRVVLRFFGGWDFPEGILDNAAFVASAYEHGVPMGQTLSRGPGPSGAPEFLVMAQKDSRGNNLQKIQMVKAWMDGDDSREEVIDIACSDGLVSDPASGRCPDNGAGVNLATCAPTGVAGDATLAVRWRDPDFDPKTTAVYYVRVLENPGCRWTAYDAIRLGVAPPQGSEPIVQERAWSSPIWYEPR